MRVDRLRRPLAVLARALAFLLGGFLLLNLLGGCVVPHFDANIWLLDVRFLPAALATPLLLFAAVMLLWFARQPTMPAWRRRITLLPVLLLLAVAVRNTLTVSRLFAAGIVHARFPLPLSLFIAAALLLVTGALLLPDRTPRPAASLTARIITTAMLALLLLILFPLAQMIFFGGTDYRRPADLIVVPGARVYADGRCSPALADRVLTACELYRAGLAPRLFFSGGPGDSVVYEAAAMKALAVREGVPDTVIIEDTAGLNSQATIDHTDALCRELGASRVLVVSHFYHLPRLKLSYQRAGRDIYTVPAREHIFMAAMPYYLAREVVALWAYYFRTPT
ncbi:MAG TPA: YdcF family protein [bacterium]|nr:YdcF family protein [bacterium]